MTQDNLVKFKTPETPESFSDALSDLIRSGAQQIIAQAVEAELNGVICITPRKGAIHFKTLKTHIEYDCAYCCIKPLILVSSGFA